MLGAGALGRPRGMVWGGRKEEGSGWGIRVYLWWIHVDIWPNQYNIVKLKDKIKKKKENPPQKKNKTMRQKFRNCATSYLSEYRNHSNIVINKKLF